MLTVVLKGVWDIVQDLLEERDVECDEEENESGYNNKGRKRFGFKGNRGNHEKSGVHQHGSSKGFKKEFDDSMMGERKNNRQGGSDSDKLAREIVVKGISYSATEEDIKRFFEENFGTVFRVNLLKSNDGKSKGMAFVRFETVDSCEKAAASSNCEFLGRYLVIEKSKQKKELAAHKDATTVFVGNLPFSVDQNSLREFFADCGIIEDARVALSADGKTRGFGFVQFQDRNGLEKALSKNGVEIEGRSIKVDVAAPKTAKKDNEIEGESEEKQFINSMPNNWWSDYALNGINLSTMQLQQTQQN